MDITPFALTPEHKGRLASLLNETGQPAAMLIPAIVKALEELQRRSVSGGTPDREAHVHASAPPRKKTHSTELRGKGYPHSAKAARGENLEVEEPVACWDCTTFDFHPTLARIERPALIGHQVVEVC